MPNPTFQAIVSAVNQSGAAFQAARTDLGAVRREADATRAALVKLDRPGAMSELRSSTKLLGEHFGALNTKVAATGGLLRSLFPALAGLGAAGSAAGIFEMINKVAESRVELMTTADALGMNTLQLERFNYAAKMSEVPVDTMQTAMARLNRNIGAAGAGKNKDALAILQRLGFSLKEIKSGAVSASDVMPALADAFQKTHNTALKSEIASIMVGRGFKALLPVWEKGGAALRAYDKDLDTLRYAFTPEDDRNLEGYHHSMIRLETSVGALGNSIGAALTPALTPLITEMTKWVTVNREWITTGIKDAVLDFVHLPWKAIGTDIKSVATGVRGLVTSLGGVKTIVEGLVVIKLARWTIAASEGLLKIAGGIDAITSALMAAIGLAMPEWLLMLIKGGGIAGGLYLGATTGKSSIATEDQEQAELKRLRAERRAGDVQGAVAAGMAVPPDTTVVTPQVSAEALSRLINSGRIISPTEPVVQPSPAVALTSPLALPPDIRFTAPPGDARGGFAPLQIAPDERYPSPYQSAGAGGDRPARPGAAVDGTLKIEINIPNQPPGARVSATTTGNVPPPEVNVGRSDPLAAF